VTERELQTAVIETAQLLGWKIAHFRPALTKRGWRTPVEGDGAGFPDLVLIHPAGRILVRELKAGRNKLRPEQADWLHLFSQAGVDAAVWRPDDWTSGRVEEELRATLPPELAAVLHDPDHPPGPQLSLVYPTPKEA
jgi:hypothetical protein